LFVSISFSKFVNTRNLQIEMAKEVEVEKRNSQEWLEIMQESHDVLIIDPDGWDRKNYNHSFYEEKISEEEFNIRLSKSTIEWNN